MRSGSLRKYSTLTRIPVTLAVTLSAFAAMVVYSHDLTASMVPLLAGIFLLAAGASAYNQYQEWPYDEKMERTRKRPIPSRQITPSDAVRISMILILGGLFILMYWVSGTCLLLGIVNILWYNGLYTYLKRKTAFAVIPGAITGAIPMLIGWVGMGGSFSDPTILFLAFFIFLWQMPHFWLLTLKYGHEYKNAGFPVLTDIFSAFQTKLLIMVWLLAAMTSSQMLVLFRIIHFPIFGYGIAVLGLFLGILIFFQLFITSSIRNKLIFSAANIYMLLVMISLLADSLWR